MNNIPAIPETPLILVVDDDLQVGQSLKALLSASRYEVIYKNTPSLGLESLNSFKPDLILLDMQLPEMNGIELCKLIRERLKEEYIPIVLMTGSDLDHEKSAALEVGADDFLLKPFNHAELIARIRSLLRTKTYYDSMKLQARELEKWNAKLSTQVKDQSGQLDRLNRLRTFFSPSISDLILSEKEDPLKSHRREVSILFVDLRGFTAFSENSEPEEVMKVLSDFYEIVGQCVHRKSGTLGNIAGDGIMAFFNDPIEMPLHIECAALTALDIRERLNEKKKNWKQIGFDLDFGIGISSGFATIGAIGFQEFWSYSVIGSTVNLAARLCSEARGGQILGSQRVYSEIQNTFNLTTMPAVALKGIQKPVVIHELQSKK